MEMIQALKNRYSTKEFDPNKKISSNDMAALETLLRLSPSSTNVQPWKYVIASTDEGKSRIAKASQGFYSFNEQKILDASAVVIFATRHAITEEYLLKVLNKEDADGRFSEQEWKEEMHGGRSFFVNLHKYDYKDVQHWAEKQIYLNLGNFLLGAAQLELDAIAMEGLDMKILDAEFGLREQGYTSTIVVAVGYRKATDFNATLPKSRLSKDEIIEHV